MDILVHRQRGDQRRPEEEVGQFIAEAQGQILQGAPQQLHRGRRRRCATEVSVLKISFKLEYVW